MISLWISILEVVLSSNNCIYCSYRIILLMIVELLSEEYELLVQLVEQ